MGANNGPKIIENEFKMPTTIFRPTSLTKRNQTKVKFFTSVFFVRFGYNLAWGLKMEEKQDRMNLKCLQPFLTYQPDQPKPTNTENF